MKTPEMENMLDGLARAMFGHGRVEGKCATCGGDAVDFRDELSRKEYSISYMCQTCQDDFFGGEE